MTETKPTFETQVLTYENVVLENIVKLLLGQETIEEYQARHDRLTVIRSTGTANQTLNDIHDALGVYIRLLRTRERNPQHV